MRISDWSSDVCSSDLSEALKRRCLFLHIDYPELEREKEIVLTKVPDITDALADPVARIVRSIRQLELKKSPSVSAPTACARTLLLLCSSADRRVGQHCVSTCRSRWVYFY